MIRDLCKWKEVNLIEGEVCIDHVHILVENKVRGMQACLQWQLATHRSLLKEIPPKISVSSFMGFLKGKTSIMIYQKYGNMKFKYRNRNFWCRGYYVLLVVLGLCPKTSPKCRKIKRSLLLFIWRLTGEVCRRNNKP